MVPASRARFKSAALKLAALLFFFSFKPCFSFFFLFFALRGTAGDTIIAILLSLITWLLAGSSNVGLAPRSHLSDRFLPDIARARQRSIRAL
jgi:hypothetical protein